jgi:hypothetical protein
MEIEITLQKLRKWYECCVNMDEYGENDNHPLLDIVQCKDGTKIKIYVNRTATGNDCCYSFI